MHAANARRNSAAASISNNIIESAASISDAETATGYRAHSVHEALCYGIAWVRPRFTYKYLFRSPLWK
jgi:hypothetical protein